MSKPVSRSGPAARPPTPVTIRRSARSSWSVTRRHVMPSGAKPAIAPERAALSAIAARKLCADWIAWKSPVKCRLMSAAGSTVARPPPVPPPFVPKSGPSEGSRIASTARFPIFARPSVSPIDVVVLPSPAGVGVIAVTTISFPLEPPCGIDCSGTLTLSRPNGSIAPHSRPSCSTTSFIARTATPLVAPAAGYRIEAFGSRASRSHVSRRPARAPESAAERSLRGLCRLANGVAWWPAPARAAYCWLSSASDSSSPRSREPAVARRSSSLATTSAGARVRN